MNKIKKQIIILFAGTVMFSCYSQREDCEIEKDLEVAEGQCGGLLTIYSMRMDNSLFPVIILNCIGAEVIRKECNKKPNSLPALW